MDEEDAHWYELLTEGDTVIRIMPDAAPNAGDVGILETVLRQNGA